MKLLPCLLTCLLGTALVSACSDSTPPNSSSAGDSAGNGAGDSAGPAAVAPGQPFATNLCPLMGPPTVVRYERVEDGERTYSVQLYNDHRDRVTRSECQGVQPLASQVLLTYRIAS